jgi:predicted nuclease of predicted toxin-antitoxin system
MNVMPIKFLVDVGVGKHVELYLAEQGHDIKTVRSIDPRMPDTEIIRLAALERRIVVTMDKDFGELVYHFARDHCGVLLLRSEDATGLEKVKIISNILDNYSDRLRNHFCVFQRGKLRLRKKRT